MEQHCALCGKYIHRSDDPITGKDGRTYHAHCYSRVKDKLEKDYEKKGFVSRVKRSFRQPEAYLDEVKGKKMRIKLSELKKLIREESLLLEGISGKSFCITGTLNRPRTEAWAAIEEAGGIVHRSVKRGTDFLVTGAAIGRSKIANAERLGVTVIDEKELWHMIRGGRRPKENPRTWKGTSGRGHGEFRVDRRFEREPSYLDLAGLTSESRELMKEMYENDYDSSNIEAEINNTEYGKYLKSVVLVSSDLQSDPDNDLFRATFVVPRQELIEMYGSEDVKAFDRDFRIEFEVYNSEPGSFNRNVSLENKSTVNDNLVFEYIFRDFYNV